MSPFITANRHEIEILDPRAVLDTLNKAGNFMEKLLSNDKTILFVGTKPSAKKLIEDFANELKQPYVINRWLGGTLTNFGVVSDRVKYYQDMKKKQKEGEFEKHTKKEQLDISNEIEKLSYKFDGLINLKSAPDAIFLVDPKEEETTILEAKKIDIPVIAVLDTNDNPNEINYPIIANDHNRSSIEWVINYLKSKVIK
jgi:small subunit ribosomal protein S2